MHCILVVICIFITVLASVQGTWFMQTLIDGYILPLIGQADPDFSGLLHAIMHVAIFYLIGALASYIYTRIMVNVSQGTLKNLRDDMFTHMEELPTATLTRTITEISCPLIRTISIHSAR